MLIEVNRTSGQKSLPNKEVRQVYVAGTLQEANVGDSCSSCAEFSKAPPFVAPSAAPFRQALNEA